MRQACTSPPEPASASIGPKDADGEDTTSIVKAVELSGVPNLLFRRNSTTGAVEVLPRKGQTVELNEALHAN